MTPDIEKLTDEARYKVNNPSAWGSFDQGASDTISGLLDALASLVRERDEARGQRDDLRLLVRECANADFIAAALARSK